MRLQPEFGEATIADGETASEAIRLGTRTLVGLVTPAAFDGTSITLQASIDGTTFSPLIDPATGDAYEIAAAASEAYYLDPIVTLPWNFVKIVAAAQTGDTVLATVVREIG